MRQSRSACAAMRMQSAGKRWSRVTARGRHRPTRWARWARLRPRLRGGARLGSRAACARFPFGQDSRSDVEPSAGMFRGRALFSPSLLERLLRRLLSELLGFLRALHFHPFLVAGSDRARGVTQDPRRRESKLNPRTSSIARIVRACPSPMAFARTFATRRGGRNHGIPHPAVP